MVNDYVNVLESYLGVKRTTFSFVERWSQCPPEEAGGKPLKEFLSKVSFLEILNTQNLLGSRVDITLSFTMDITSTTIFEMNTARSLVKSLTLVPT